MVLARQQVRDDVLATISKFVKVVETLDWERFWDELSTFSGTEMMSLVYYPLLGHHSGTLDMWFVQPNDGSYAIDSLAVAFQSNMNDFRRQELTKFLTGISGWVLGNIKLDQGMVLTRSSTEAAIYAQPGVEKDVVIPCVRESGSYYVDLSSLYIFDQFLSAESIYLIASKFLGHERVVEAMRLFEMCGELQEKYDQLRDLWWEHSIAGKSVTEERKTELLSDYTFTLLAKEQARILRQSIHIPSPYMAYQSILGKLFSNYDLVPETVVEDSDLELLKRMEEDDLRSRIAKVLTGVDPVVALRSARQPHSGYEISDLDIVTNIHGEEWMVSLPFKSGKEYRREKTVPYSVLSQVLRPHLFFSTRRVLSVLITVHPCSTVLRRDILLHRDKFGSAIEVVEGRDLAALLKANDLL